MKIFLRFYNGLNNFLPYAQQGKTVVVKLFQNSTVKDTIESLGVPHPEVDLLLINGESMSFDTLLKDGDHVSVYPMFMNLDISSVSRLRPQPLIKMTERPLKFVVDVNLGKLAHFLRMLGFDVTFHRKLESDAELAFISRHENRVLLTRDVGLLKRKNVDFGYYVRSHLPKEQTLEVLRRFNLINFIRLCSRCLECNVPIQSIDKDQVLSQLPPLVAKFYSKFYVCPHCHKIYWEGTHFKHMRESVEQWKKELSP
ncbi:MAG: Mut7-C RNAse domain-containing protein [Pseudobdellovibrionaceae bacterium]